MLQCFEKSCRISYLETFLWPVAPSIRNRPVFSYRPLLIGKFDGAARLRANCSIDSLCCSKLEPMTICVVNQAWSNDIMPAVYKIVDSVIRHNKKCLLIRKLNKLSCRAFEIIRSGMSKIFSMKITGTAKALQIWVCKILIESEDQNFHE